VRPVPLLLFLLLSPSSSISSPRMIFVAAFHKELPKESKSADLRASATALDEGKGCLRTKASSSLMVLVVIGDRSLSDCAVATAKSACLLADCPVKSFSARAVSRRTQHMLHALVCGSLFDRLQRRHWVRRMLDVYACGGGLRYRVCLRIMLKV
jgi:hypothetical protein